MPDLSDLNDVKVNIISTAGDLDRWEIEALVSEPKSVEAIADLLNHQITSNTPHAKGAITVSLAGANNSAINWKFTDEEGRGWNGEGRIDSAPDHPGQFVVTLKLTRLPTAKSI